MGLKKYTSDTGAFDHPTKMYGIQILERIIASITSFEDSFNILALFSVNLKEYKRISNARVEVYNSGNKAMNDSYAYRYA